MYVVPCWPTHGLSTRVHDEVRSVAERLYRPMLVAAKTLPWPSKVNRPMRWLNSSSPPTPVYESELVFASPVPTHSERSAGLTASAPVESVGASSVSGVHEEPPSVVFQTPPSAAPMYSVAPSVASAVTRPLTSPAPPPELDQTGSR